MVRLHIIPKLILNTVSGQRLVMSNSFGSFKSRSGIISLTLTVFILVGFALKADTAPVYPALDDEEDEFSSYASLNQTCLPYDPYERLNRKIYYFNAVLDTFILRPVAKGYIRFTNDYTKDRIGSFVHNIDTPLSTVQYALQGNSEGTLKSFWRFVINTTVGIGGLFDVAGKIGLHAAPQTFGNTLATYGVGPGPYIVLPLYGSTSGRGVTDPLITNNAFNPLKYKLHGDFKLGVTGAKAIHERAELMPFTDYVTKNSPDTYIAIRDAYLQSRESKMVYPKGFKCPSVK